MQLAYWSKQENDNEEPRPSQSGLAAEQRVRPLRLPGLRGDGNNAATDGGWALVKLVQAKLTFKRSFTHEIHSTVLSSSTCDGVLNK
jgi:hypothetical protein